MLDAETGALCELDVDGEVLEFDREGARVFIMRDTTLGVSDVTWT